MLKTIYHVVQLINFKNIGLLLLFFLISGNLYAQDKGSVSGKIVDESTNEELIGANILLEGTTIGGASDIEGNYTIKSIPPGKYNLVASMLGYSKLIITGLEIKAGEEKQLNISLKSEALQTEDVVVTAEALKNTEVSVLKIQQRSADIVDGVSSELIKKNNSSNGTDILKRMTGITMSEGKYAYVRGVSDRYNNTLLNGATLPSTDPEKKSFSYDLFPASLIENVITAKTFTPDKPADFAGGLVQINTIEFPSRFIFDFSTGGTYNTNTTGKNFTTYPGGGKDFLGYDDGSRGMPSTITSTKVARGNYTNDELTAITESFKNDWSTHSVNAPFNGSFKLDVGDKYEVGDNSVFGFIGSINYSNSGSTKNLEKSFYDYGSVARYSYNGASYTRNVNWNGLLNLSYKFSGTNKISFKNLYNQNADDITSFFSGDYRYAEQYREVTSLNYVSRSLSSDQLIGEHAFNIFSGTDFKWNLSFSQSKRNEPDARRYVYKRNLDQPVSTPLIFLLDPSVATRYYGDLIDKNLDGSFDFTVKLFDNPQLPKIKFGYAYNKKNRNFDARSFGFRNVSGGDYLREDSVLHSSVDQIFLPENMTNKFIQVIEDTKPSDSYTSNQYIRAGYFMFDATVLAKLRIVAGARYENSSQDLNTVDLRGEPLNVKNNYNDVLPSINLTYNFNDNINFRAAYSTTLTRPQFREMAPFSYFNFIDNTLIEGNPDLKRTLIHNYDFRFEIYPGAGELLAFSLFYKSFGAPIEQTLEATQNEPVRSFANADKATNYGLELEIRKNLIFISPFFQNFSLVGNVTLIHSKVEISNNAFQQSERALQGQAPYIFNIGLYYDDFNLGLNAAVTYNKVGQRIANVGTKQLGNILEQPVDLIDFSISKAIFNSFTLKFSVKDLLNQDRTQIQEAPGGNKVVDREKFGRNISLGISYKL